MTRRQGKARERGSALIVTVVLLVILTIVALGLVTRNANEIDAAGAVRHYASATSCADGARQLLFAEFSIYGVAPTDLTLDTTIGDKTYTSGHYNNFDLKSVVVAGGSGDNGAVGVSDVVNRSGSPHLGSKLYRMTVVCSDTDGSHQDEVEFLVRFGI